MLKEFLMKALYVELPNPMRSIGEQSEKYTL
jgi:hypothetical protein